MVYRNKLWKKLMDFGGRIGCHQMPERSFFIKGYQFPVCARCTGVLIGELITIILIILGIEINVFWSVTLLLIMGLDWFIQYINLVISNNIRRLITGTLGGVGLTFMYYHFFIFIFNTLKNFVF